MQRCFYSPKLRALLHTETADLSGLDQRVLPIPQTLAISDWRWWDWKEPWRWARSTPASRVQATGWHRPLRSPSGWSAYYTCQCPNIRNSWRRCTRRLRSMLQIAGSDDCLVNTKMAKLVEKRGLAACFCWISAWPSLRVRELHLRTRWLVHPANFRCDWGVRFHFLISLQQ